MTETWVRDGETVTWNQIFPPSYSVLHQSQESGRGWHYLSETLFPSGCSLPTILPALNVLAKENLATWLVYWLLNTPADALPNLLEAVSRWALEHPRLVVLGDLNVHADDASSSQTKDVGSSMEATGYTLFISTPMHQAGHILELSSPIYAPESSQLRGTYPQCQGYWENCFPHPCLEADFPIYDLLTLWSFVKAKLNFASIGRTSVV